jgi:hypothetical protein
VREPLQLERSIAETRTRARGVASRKRLLAQRAAIAAVFGQLEPSFRETRSALNALARIVGSG